jgi:hypothetical protein
MVGVSEARKRKLDKAGAIINVRGRFQKPDLRGIRIGKCFSLNVKFRQARESADPVVRRGRPRGGHDRQIGLGLGA